MKVMDEKLYFNSKILGSITKLLITLNILSLLNLAFTRKIINHNGIRKKHDQKNAWMYDFLIAVFKNRICGEIGFPEMHSKCCIIIMIYLYFTSHLAEINISDYFCVFNLMMKIQINIKHP